MRNHWLVQGLVSNWLSSLIPLAVGGVLLYLSKQGSPWTTPILVGVAGLALTLVCVIAFRHLFGSSIRNVDRRVRIWLDHAEAATKSIAVPDTLFSYQVIMNSKNFVIAQMKPHPEYLHFQTELIFTEEDNRFIATLPGGTTEAARSLLLHLALLRVGHSGVEVPLAKVTLFSRVLITPDFNEQKFIEEFYKVEAAFNLVRAILATKSFCKTATCLNLPP